MVGLLFIFFIGRWFYNLVQGKGWQAWGLACIGVVSYYFGTITFVVVIELLDAFVFTEISLTLVEVVSFIPGLLFCYMVYVLCKKYIRKSQGTGSSTANKVQEFGAVEKDQNFEEK